MQACDSRVGEGRKIKNEIARGLCIGIGTREGNLSASFSCQEKQLDVAEKNDRFVLSTKSMNTHSSVLSCDQKIIAHSLCYVPKTSLMSETFPSQRNKQLLDRGKTRHLIKPGIAPRTSAPNAAEHHIFSFEKIPTILVQATTFHMTQL